MKKQSEPMPSKLACREHHHRNDRREQAFTLVEILMVIAILGLLISILTINFQRQREQAKIAQTKTNLEILRSTIQIYYNQEREWPDKFLAKLYDGNSPSGTIYLPKIPKEAFHNDSTVQAQSTACGYNGGWCVHDSPSSFGVYVDAFPGEQDVNGDNIQFY